MVKLLTLSLRNFKGATDVKLDIAERNLAPVTTLIGLNESGKTTILEGLSNFATRDDTVSSLFVGAHSKGAIADFIPVSKKAAFTESISIDATFEVEELDISTASKLAESHGCQIDEARLRGSLKVSSEFKFEDSVFKKRTNFWRIELWIKSGENDDYSRYVQPADPKAPNLWLEIVNEWESRMPKIVYFPTFLVDFPRIVYLQEHEGESAANRYYRGVLQEILAAIDDTPVTREVIGSWSKVFQRPSGAKSVSIDWNIDTSKNDLPYAAFFLSDGESRYALSDRSLGFRWFFTFLLFTAFKKTPGRGTIFLFDEPAANLHARAQAELLKSFERITGNENRIIFSTHSHHMINPKWLSSAYIIENKAVDYDSKDGLRFDTPPTNISAIPYRKFVAEYPTRVTYFQPVIEALEYVAPEVIGAAPFIIVEGITDYYALRYVRDRNPDDYKNLALMPGAGAGSSGPLISYLLGRGEQFLLVLDDDAAGRRAAEKYRGEWFLTENLRAYSG